MLVIYGVILEVAKELQPVVDCVGRCDPDLGRQMRRALCSVALNVSEGMGSYGGNERARYFTALGSMNETMTCVELAQTFGYVEPIEPDLLDRMKRIVGTLVNLTRKKRR